MRRRCTSPDIAKMLQSVQLSEQQSTFGSILADMRYVICTSAIIIELLSASCTQRIPVFQRTCLGLQITSLKLRSYHHFIFLLNKFDNKHPFNFLRYLVVFVVLLCLEIYARSLLLIFGEASLYGKCFPQLFKRSETARDKTGMFWLTFNAALH